MVGHYIQRGLHSFKEGQRGSTRVKIEQEAGIEGRQKEAKKKVCIYICTILYRQADRGTHTR